MRKIFLLLIFCIVIIGCFQSEPIDFPDPNLESAIRARIHLGPTEPIFKKELKTITYLSVREKGVSNLAGLENVVNLRQFDCRQNFIDDITPLMELTKLKDLDLSYNQITDISALAGLRSLEYLKLRSNFISNVSVIREFIVKYKNMFTHLL